MSSYYELAPGSVIGEYKLIQEIGRGGMGKVFSAENVNIGRPVAIKFLKPQAFENDEELTSKFQAECRALGRINHPNVLQIYHASLKSSPPYLVMELIKGYTLLNLMGPNLNPRHAVKMGINVADALQAAHEAGVIHRDVKPSNIGITHKNETKLMDLGIAFLVENLSKELQKEGTEGSIHYMAPEQINSACDPRYKQYIGPHTDVYQLATVIWECLSLKRKKFTSKNPSALLIEALESTLKPPSYHNPEIPSQWDAVIARGIAKEIENRYSTAREFREALRSLITNDNEEAQDDENEGTFLPKGGMRKFSLEEVVRDAHNEDFPEALFKQKYQTFLLVPEEGWHLMQNYNYHQMAGLFIHGYGWAPGKQSFTLGRLESNDIVIDSPGISRKHLEFSRSGKNYWVRDTGSKFGTTLNALKVTDTTQIKNGDLLILGRTMGAHFMLPEAFLYRARSGLTRVENPRNIPAITPYDDIPTMPVISLPKQRKADTTKEQRRKGFESA